MRNEPGPPNICEPENTVFHKNDFLIAVLLWIGSFIALIDSVRMTFYIKLPFSPERTWLVAPGLLPMFLSGGLLIMLSALIIISYRQGEFKDQFSMSALVKSILQKERFSKTLQAALLCLYVLVLTGNIQFGISTALYLAFSMLLSRAAKFYQIVLISITFSASITYAFGTLMKIPLP
ncbi:tripartite tricarboxylate transporter TctB family protein [Gilvimarinus agarilyticus]|uniref:tripartite tricarboxylate transporter TctB family protein n=1 Tax=Gilvimarinus agarilyticus TaxID=679259 RepID=UPI0005A0D1DB|nr:tripartite tricarboxylate transporter TctB family protein [Gilvimarinus agarilyticus]